MRQLFINGSLVDLDTTTAIGLNFQNGDISDPTQKLLSTTNSFSLPITSNNQKIFNFIKSPFSLTSLPYQKLTTDFFDGNIHLIKEGNSIINKIGERIEITCISSKTIIDTLKEKTLRDLMRENFDDGGLSWNTLSDLVDDIATNNVLNLNLVYWALNEEGYNSFFLNQHLNGTIALRPLQIIEWIEDFSGYSLILTGSVFDDVIFDDLNIPFYDLIPFKFYAGGLGTYKLYLFDDPLISAIYGTATIPNIDKEFAYYGIKTVMDFLRTIAVMTGSIIEVNETTKQIILTRTNDIFVSSATKNWTNKIIKSEKKFSFGNFAINNIIKYKLDEGINETAGRIEIISNNNNLAQLKEYTIDCILPRSIYDPLYGYHYLLGSTDKEQKNLTVKPLSEIIILLDNTILPTALTFFADYEDSGGIIQQDNYSKIVKTVVAYDFSARYSELEKVLQNTIVYDAEIYLNLLDIHNFSSSNLVNIENLGGTFYVNKITGFNFNSKKGTKVELIKIR